MVSEPRSQIKAQHNATGKPLTVRSLFLTTTLQNEPVSDHPEPTLQLGPGGVPGAAACRGSEASGDLDVRVWEVHKLVENSGVS